METLLVKMLPVMAKETGLNLVPTYSYATIYKNGDILKRHKDRPSCEISTTLNLGGDPWPIFIDGTGADTVIDEYKNIHKPNAPEGTKVLLEVGDMLVYSGCELEHWREPFEGQVCGQVFLHYNHRNGPFAENLSFVAYNLITLHLRKCRKTQHWPLIKLVFISKRSVSVVIV